MQRCDCCGKFGDVEEVTITIKKHKDCDVNVLFGHNSGVGSAKPFVAPITSQSKTDTSHTDAMFRSIDPVLTEDMPPIPQDFINKTIQGK